MSKIKLAIDFGEAYTNIYMLGSGLVLSEPTVAAVIEGDKFEVKCIGKDAKKLIGKTTKNTKIVFPVFEGEVVNIKVASYILSGFLKKIGVNNRSLGIQAIFSVPCGVTPEIVENLKLVSKNVGIDRVYFAEAPILSAFGQRIPMNDSTPCFVIDMGGGTTNIAAVNADGVISGVSVNIGGNKITTDIIDYILDNYGVEIGLLSAEKLRKSIGTLEDGDGLSAVVNGRDKLTGNPKAISIKACDILPSIKKYFDSIYEVVSSLLGKLAPEVSAIIRHTGIYLSGICCTIYGLTNYYKDLLNIDINISENPQFALALGGGIIMGNEDLLKNLKI